eukprot:9460887-Prorocentrum_lima.AAC.1
MAILARRIFSGLDRCDQQLLRPCPWKHGSTSSPRSNHGAHASRCPPRVANGGWACSWLYLQ